MISREEIKEKYPIHWLVWNNEITELDKFLENPKCDIEKLDSRGRTPLMLAVKLGNLQAVKSLLAVKCNANFECNGWSVVQEAVCTGDAAILTAILEVRDLQRHIQRVTHVPELLQRLCDAPDFYVEMKWEFTSWVPLMARFCPSDVYKVYKRGPNVRIDTTLLGFDHTTWQRGNRSYVFKGHDTTASMIEIDHDAQEVSVEQFKGIEGDIYGIPPPPEAVTARLSTPVTSNHIDMEKISFERNKSGIWGWRSEKSEEINGYDCKVYAASNVEFVTKTRTEHLNEAQAKTKSARTPLHNLFGLGEEESLLASGQVEEVDKSPSPPTKSHSDTDLSGACGGSAIVSSDNSPTTPPVTPEEYFSDTDLSGRDIGRKPKESMKVQRFKANLWLSEEFPIKLQEQVLPILDLMSTMASPHVSKLKDFITMQLPAGFPIKMEIPLFHVLSACVTFGNVFGLERRIDMVEHIRETDTERLTCVLDDHIFDIPVNYRRRGTDFVRQMTYEEEDDLLEYAIQQSLLDGGNESDKVDIWEALKVQRPITPSGFSDEDAQLQRVLQESMSIYGNYMNSNQTTNQNQEESPDSKLPTSAHDADLEMALRLSEQLEKERQIEIDRENEMLEQVLKLSMEEK